MQSTREGVVVVIDCEHTDELALPTQAFVSQQEVDRDGHLL